MKQNLLKTMFVAAGLVLGTMGGWAQTVLYERGTSDKTAWTADNLSDFTASTGSLVLTNYGAQITTTNTTVNVSKTIAPSKDAILNVEAVWLGMSNVGRYWKDGGASYFKFGNIYILENDQENKNPSAYSLNGFSASNYTNFTGPTGVRNYDPATRPFYIIKIEINTATNKLNYLKVYSSEDENKELLNVVDQPLVNADYTTIAFGYIKGSRITSNQVEILKSVKVTETEQTVAKANYTVKYVDEDNNEIKTSEERTGEVGASVSLLDTDKASFFNADNSQKYIYVSDNVENATIEKDGSTVVTVKFRKAATYNYTVNAVCDNAVLQQVASGTNLEGESFTVPYNKYILKNGILYVGTQGDKNIGFYQKSVSLTENNLVANVEYKESSIKNIVFCSEAEDIPTLTSVESGNVPVRCSGGKAGYAAEDAVITKLSAGVYKVKAAVFGNTGQTFEFKVGDKAIFTPETKGYFIESESDNFTVDGNADLILSAGGSAGNSPKVVDYVIVEKIADLVKVSDLNYATYVPACNVVAPENVKVYTAKANEAKTSVTLNEIPAGTVIPAGAAVLVGAPADTYTFTASAETASAIGENDLVAATADTKGDGATTYALTSKDGKPVFGLVAEGVAIPEGKAYLQLSAASAAKFFTIGTGVVTGINEVNVATNDADDAYYTLQGMKTNKAVKGIYIHNGKKVVIK